MQSEKRQIWHLQTGKDWIESKQVKLPIRSKSAPMSTKTERRSEVIMKQLLGHGEATVEELVELTGTSSPSIRRDLIALERRGLIRRTHGGAALVEPLLYEPFRYDESFQAREQRNAAQKRHIGLAAAQALAAAGPTRDLRNASSGSPLACSSPAVKSR